MSYTREVLSRARQRLEADNRKKEAEAAENLAKAYARLPRLRDIDRELRRTSAAVVAACFDQGRDPGQAVRQIRARNRELQAERQWILDDAEISEDSLDNSPLCNLCGGSGYKDGKMCECLHELCRQEQRHALSPLLPTGKERFEYFSTDLYPDRYYPSIGTTPRKLMQRNLNYCRKYAADFQPGAGSLLFSGATGLGKTFLSACIARQVTDRGFGVVYASAAKLFSDYEGVKFDRLDPGAIEGYTACDLLILDDLGTEMTTPLVISSLYQLVNSRILERKATLISTNLRPEDLEPRYGGQIASRLLGNYELVVFEGEDIRRLRNK